MEKFPPPQESNEGEFEKSKIPLVEVNELIAGIKSAPPLEEYKKSIAEDADSSFAGTLKDKLEYHRKRQNEKVAEFFKELENQILVDLGAGNSAAGYHIATKLKAKAYVGIEPIHYNSLRELFTEYAGSIAKQTVEEGRAVIPAALEHEDALTFLRRLPNGSVSIMANGIDEYILDDIDYIWKLDKEIARVLNKDGAVISYRSVIGIEDNKNISQSFSDDIDGLAKYTYKKNRKP